MQGGADSNAGLHRALLWLQGVCKVNWKLENQQLKCECKIFKFKNRRLKYEMQNISAKCEFRHFQQAIQEGQAIKEEVIIKINQSV